MRESKTPRSDDAIQGILSYGGQPNVVLCSLARQLEIELSQANSDLADIRDNPQDYGITEVTPEDMKEWKTLDQLQRELTAANERSEKAIDSLERSGVDAKRWQERAEKYREIAKEFRRICNGVILMTDHIKEYDSSLDVLRNEEFTNAISKLEKLEEGK